MIIDYEGLPTILKTVIRISGTQNGSLILIDHNSNEELHYSWCQKPNGDYDYGIRQNNEKEGN